MIRALRFITTGWLVGMVILVGAPDARAEGSPYRVRLNEISRRDALSGRTVQVLEAVSPDLEERTARIIDLLAESPDRRVHIRNPGRGRRSGRSMIVFAADESWYLEVIGDGSRFRYRGNIDDPAEIERDRMLPSLDMATLETLGRAYVNERLAPLVPLGSGETMVFLGTRYLRDGSFSEVEPLGSSEVVANIALFAREVMGTFVAGPGSKIAVWFSNRGEAVGFDVDWPEYRVASAVQSTLPIGEVWSRFSAYADAPLPRIQSNLRSVECGYVDLGVFKRQGSPVQAGCYALHTGPMEAGTVYASSEVIPIGTPVMPDPHWPVTEFVAAERAWDICVASPESCLEPPTVITNDTEVTRMSGIAHGVGLGPTRTGIAMVGTFQLTGKIDLAAVPSMLTISQLLSDGTNDVTELPLTLLSDPRNTSTTAYFRTSAGTEPIAKVAIGARGGGKFTFRIEVSKTTSVASAQCPHPTFTTTFGIRDGVNPPAEVSTQQPWLCFGRRNEYLKSRR